MKVVVHSNAPWAGTGYGSQCQDLVRGLNANGHDAVVSAFYGLSGSILNWEGTTIYPAGYDLYGNDVILAHAQNHFGGDLLGGLIITLVDVWVLNAANMTRANVACWTPIDHEPAPPRVLDFLRAYGGFTLAMSRFGENELRNQGIEDVYYVPHGVDTETFSPAPMDAARDALGIPQDAFVISMVAANKGFPPRKGFPEALQAYARFAAEHEDAFLYLHTDCNGTVEGVNLSQIMATLGIDGSRVKFTDPYHYLCGMPSAHVVNVYSASDVVLNPAYGEGFGIPVVEAQACGAPVITTNWTAMPELTGAGWIVEGQRFWTMQGSWWKVPDVESIEAALAEAYKTRGPEIRAVAREFALQYDSRAVYQNHWAPTLAEIEEKMGKPAIALAA